MIFRSRYLVWIFLFFPFGAGFAGGSAEKSRVSPEYTLGSGTSGSAEIPELDASQPDEAAGAVLEPLAVPQERQEPGRAETVMRAIEAAYPDRVGPAVFRSGDWAIQVYEEWFYFAEGRLLPEALRDKVSEYDPQPFYNYAAELSPWKQPTPEESARMKEQEANRRSRPSKRSQHFYDALWRSRTKDESWEHIKQIRFLGQPVQVHYSILEELSLVEERILRLAKTNAAVRQWANNLKTVDAWNWRNIASSQSRSYHAYGAAIDFLPKSLGSLETYWLWTARTNPEWWTVPYTKRFHPPDEVIKIFESFGFIWGGF
jgi:hypothetical protein